ncbi:FGGY family carbohydrate kinase, partial [Alteromonas sp. 14N.309.X.WAT.G.H12]|uniref:FGGY family carbohydrate kinase n=1 Tax=Alteromonas sp. 14N.309.X.WAT.G.H12 TaxID=3120824 RepID=UPI002FCF2FD0
MHFLGIDLGTSGLKAVVCNKQGDVIASQSAPLTVSTPQVTHVGSDQFNPSNACSNSKQATGVA